MLFRKKIHMNEFIRVKKLELLEEQSRNENKAKYQYEIFLNDQSQISLLN